ncbi:MAG TPA: phytase, partial [Acidimicrobiia bacterium]|nr:phytase [Acidimicrobiia bacterium]
MQSAPHSPTTTAKSRRALGAALGLVLLAGAAPFLTPANAAMPEGNPAAAAETAVIADAQANDPAIWVNPTNEAQSLILGANDTRLVTYDMTGAVVAQDETQVPAGTTAGDVTGVDVRRGVTVGAQPAADIAAVVGNKIIRFYAIDPATRRLTDMTIAPEGINPETMKWRPRSARKVCMYTSPVSHTTYAFIMADNGQMAQLELKDVNGKIDAAMVRGGTTDASAWDVSEGTVSGCAVDDAAKALYVSDTKKGIVKFGAEPTDPTDPAGATLIDSPAPTGNLLPSVKGLAVVGAGDTAGYLIASTVDVPSAAVNNKFNVYNRADGTYTGRQFEVAAGAADQCDLTEGIEAAVGNFGAGFATGMFICQDKTNRPASGGGTNEANNYKMVRLETVVDPTVVTTTTTIAPVETSTTTTTAPVQIPNNNRSGYWMVGSDGKVFEFGDAKHYGNIDLGPGAQAVDLEPTPSGNGYWVIDDLGHVFAKGDARHHGDVNRSLLTAAEVVTSLSATKSGNGYWIFTSAGRVIPFGDAVFHGDMSKVKLNGPVLDSIPSASGKGYYMVASDGGIFTFGDAEFKGSMGDKPLNKPVQSLVPDADGIGYWLVASDGGVFAFEAPFRGSMGGTPLNKPVTGMVAYG